MADLKTTYKDDVLDTSVNEKRKYNMIQNADGTVSFEDVTTYSQIGDSFGAADINATNKKVNEVNSNLNGFSFDTVNNEDGYYKGGTFHPFGNPYLRYDEGTGYIQALDEDGNWIDVYYAGQLPMIAKYFIFNSVKPSADLLSVSNNAGNKPTLTVSGNSVLWSFSPTAWAVAYCQGALVNFNNYSKMVIEFGDEFTSSYAIGIGYSTDNSSTCDDKYATFKQTYSNTSLSNQTVEIDISNVSGEFYPTIKIQASSTTKINMVIKNWYFIK